MAIRWHSDQFQGAWRPLVTLRSFHRFPQCFLLLISTPRRLPRPSEHVCELHSLSWLSLLQCLSILPHSHLSFPNWTLSPRYCWPSYWVFRAMRPSQKTPWQLLVLQFPMWRSSLEPNSEPGLPHAHPSPYRLRFIPNAPCQHWILP